MILELNHCLEEILRANNGVKTAADLATKYRKNVQYNLEAIVAASDKPESGSIWEMYAFPLPQIRNSTVESTDLLSCILTTMH